MSKNRTPLTVGAPIEHRLDECPFDPDSPVRPRHHLVHETTVERDARYEPEGMSVDADGTPVVTESLIDVTFVTTSRCTNCLGVLVEERHLNYELAGKLHADVTHLEA